MVNENETVDKACLILYAHPEAEAFDGSGFTVLNNKEIADSIIAAHKRELAEKDAEIKRLTNIINAECNKCADCAKFGVDCSAGDVDGNEDCRACEKFISKEVAAKDAEIAELREHLREAVKWSCGNPNEACEDCVAHGGDTPCKCEKWRKALEGGAEDSANNLRALVSGLVEGVQYPPLCKDCDDSCEIRSECKILKFRSLVEKAKEVLNG